MENLSARETRNIYGLGLGASYIRELTVGIINNYIPDLFEFQLLNHAQ